VVFVLNRRLIVLSAGLAVAGIVLYLNLYAPLLTRFRTQGEACRLAEAEVTEARDLIAAFKAKEIEKTLIQEPQVSETLEEVTRTGNQVGITFASVTPHTPEEGEGHRVLPIEMELESSYEGLGQFLGELDDLKGSLITVRDFIITPKSEDPLKLTARLSLNLYLAEAEHAG